MINSNPTIGSIMKEVTLMKNNKLAKQQAQLEKLNAQIKEEKNNIDKKLGQHLQKDLTKPTKHFSTDKNLMLPNSIG